MSPETLRNQTAPAYAHLLELGLRGDLSEHSDQSRRRLAAAEAELAAVRATLRAARALEAGR